MGKLFKVIIKSVDGNYYNTPFIDYICRKGDVITIDGERFVVIGGDVLPR